MLQCIDPIHGYGDVCIYMWLDDSLKGLVALFLIQH